MRIAFFTSNQLGLNVLHFLTIKPDYIFVPETSTLSDKITSSDVQEILPEAKVIGLRKYRISKEDLMNYEFDIAFVVGWHRIIPEDVLTMAKYGFWGVHAGIEDELYLTIGHTPYTWAFITNSEYLYLFLFKLNEKIDGGGVYKKAKLKITEFDDIRTLRNRSSLVISKMIVELLNRSDYLEDKILIFPPEDLDEFRFLPKRIKEDGEIDWCMSPFQIYNFVRSQTLPYPGAYSHLSSGEKITILKGVPLSGRNCKNCNCGEIIETFHDESFIVCTKNGSFLVTDWFSEDIRSFFRISRSSKFISVNCHTNLEKIIERHKKKFPEYKINEKILQVCNQ